MDLALPLILEVSILLIMLIPGILLKRFRLVGPDFGRGLSNFVLYIAQSALIVNAYIAYRGDGSIWTSAFLVLGFSLLAHFLFAVVSLLFFRRAEDGARRMLRFATVFANAAFMGIPIIQVLFGSEAVIYASLYNIGFNLFVWSFGVWLCTAGREGDGEGGAATTSKLKIQPRKVLLHPVLISSYIGVFFLATGLGPSVPSLFSRSLAMLSDLVAPLSMVVIGLRMNEFSVKEAFRDKHLYLFIALRLLLLPLTLMLIMLGLQVIGLPLPRMVRLVLLILASTPAAASSTMFAEKYDCAPAYVSRLVILSTLLSVLTIPLVVMLDSLVF